VKIAHLRVLMIVALIGSAGFAAWSWMRPYAWSVDSKARCRIAGVQVKRDLSNYWLDLHLKLNEGMDHDLSKPVRLITASGKEYNADDTTLSGDKGRPITEIWLKFWLDAADFVGPLKLRINEGELDVRTGTGVPPLDSSEIRYFPTHKW
jgi:hypothetical protein